MANGSPPHCTCRQGQAEAMKKGRQLGLDELMIVNPGPLAGEAIFLGEDGTVYQVQGLGADTEPQGTGELFLGEDGTLYQVQGLSSNGSAQETPVDGLDEATSQELGRYFLGEDGTLYEVKDR
jgi:hypothetical protein